MLLYLGLRQDRQLGEVVKRLDVGRTRPCGAETVSVERKSGCSLGNELGKPPIAEGSDVVRRPIGPRLGLGKHLTKISAVACSLRAPADQAARNVLQWHGQPEVDRLWIGVQTRTIVSNRPVPRSAPCRLG